MWYFELDIVFIYRFLAGFSAVTSPLIDRLNLLLLYSIIVVGRTMIRYDIVKAHLSVRASDLDSLLRLCYKIGMIRG